MYRLRRAGGLPLRPRYAVHHGIHCENCWHPVAVYSNNWSFISKRIILLQGGGRWQQREQAEPFTQRHWRRLPETPSTSSGRWRFRLLNLNILADSLAHEHANELYPRLPRGLLVRCRTAQRALLRLHFARQRTKPLPITVSTF